MGLFITILHVVLCTILILIILLQPSKGSDVGAAFGGGSSSSMFGPRGAGSMLSRATTVVAVLFMATSISLALRSTPGQLSGDELEEGVLGGGLDDDILGLKKTEPAAEENIESPIEPPSLGEELDEGADGTTPEAGEEAAAEAPVED